MNEVSKISNLDDLIKELHRIFESDKVNIEFVHDLMTSYKSNSNDWNKYAKFDRHKYTRNLVDAGNGKFNLMILAWSEGQGSSIHDHSNSHCFMKILEGSLTEIKFQWPEESQPDAEMITAGENTLRVNQVAYINDSIGLHRVENQSHTETAVSLHLYCPPFDACLMFDPRTGHRAQCKVSFWSRYGERTPFEVSKKKIEEEEGLYENN